MPIKPFELKLEPAVLRWARESIGMDMQSAARKLRISEKRFIDMESGRFNPTYGTIERLAKLYKRPVAALFLKSPPKEPPLPIDFRVPSGHIPKKDFTTKTFLAMRKARRLQSLTLELSKALNQGIGLKLPEIRLNSDPEQVALRIRASLKIDISEQLEWRDSRQALNQWIRKIEGLGIMVCQMSLPMDELKGFSLATGDPKVIVVNSGDPFINSRIFTLFHELAHILIRQDGICNPYLLYSASSGMSRTEIFCNKLAGAMLVPGKDFVKLIETRQLQEIDDYTLKTLSTKFKVSQDVILRRLYITGLIGRSEYERKSKELQDTFKKIPVKKGGGPQDPAMKCIRENSRNFVSLAFDAHESQTISYRDLISYLSIRSKHIPAIGRLLSK